MVRNYDYDACCKRVLSHKWVLARLFKTYLNEYENCTLNEIIQLIEYSGVAEPPCPVKIEPPRSLI